MTDKFICKYIISHFVSNFKYFVLDFATFFILFIISDTKSPQIKLSTPQTIKIPPSHSPRGSIIQRVLSGDQLDNIRGISKRRQVYAVQAIPRMARADIPAGIPLRQTGVVLHRQRSALSGDRPQQRLKNKQDKGSHLVLFSLLLKVNFSEPPALAEGLRSGPPKVKAFQIKSR